MRDRSGRKKERERTTGMAKRTIERQTGVEEREGEKGERERERERVRETETEREREKQG